MKIIHNYTTKINEELNDATDYAEKYIEERAKDNISKANKYREMANDELKHAGYIHDLAINEVSEIEKIYTVPVDTVEKLERAHKEYAEKSALIKQMLNM